MMRPKLTRSRFLLLWGAGVALLLLISWRKILNAGEIVPNRQYAESRQKSSTGVLVPKLNWNEGLQNFDLNNLQDMPPPSSVLDLIQTGKVAHHGQSAIGLAQLDSNSDMSRFPVDQSDSDDFPFPDGDARPDAKMANHPDPDISFLLPSPQERKDDQNVFSEVNTKPSVNVDDSPDVAAESSSLSSDASSQHGESDQVAMVTSKHANTRLFDEKDSRLLLPNVARRDRKHNDIDMLHEDNSRFLPPYTRVVDSNKVAIEPAKAANPGFLDQETIPLLPSVHHDKDNDKDNKISLDTAKLADAGSRGDDKQTNPASSDLNLSNAIIHQPVRNDAIQRLSQDNALGKDVVVINEGKPIGQGVAEPAGSKLRQPHQSTLSEGLAVRIKVGTQKDIPPDNETEAEFQRRMEEVQNERHARIQRHCLSRYNMTLLDFQRDRHKILSWKKYFEHAYANDDHQFIICRVLKVGSFSWRKVMISLYNKGSSTFRRSQSKGDYPMMDYGDAMFMSKLEKYKKVLFIREPFARFLSAYRDKYVELRHFPYYKPIGSSIIQKYRHNPTQAEIASGKPNFEEFTKWVIAEEVPEGDFHWRPLFNVYHPCEISYDYIGKLETSADDAKYIFKMIGIDKLETYPSTETHHKFSSSAEILKAFYSQLSPELLPKLIERYKEEFDLFDYPIPQKMSDIWTRT